MVEDPTKELRFTRARQAIPFCLMGAVFCGVGVTLLATGWYRDVNPMLPHPLWAVPCLLAGLALFWLARHLTKHAYMILTPLGVEVFPFFRPAQGMQLITWQEIAGAEVSGSGKWLTLHFNEEKTAGTHLSLSPIRKAAAPLLIEAVQGRMREKSEQSS